MHVARRSLLIAFLLLGTLWPAVADAAWPDDVQPGSRPTAGVPVPTSAPAAIVVPANRPGALYYTVRPGDSLWPIARRFGVTVAVLQNANGFGGKKVLREGMQLYIPFSNEVGSARYGPDGPIVAGGGLHFVASIQQQTCWLFRDGALMEKWSCSTGRPGSPSIPGNYTVQSKLPRAYSAAADFWMPAWLGIYDAGVFENGIHGIPYRAGNGERLWTDLVGVPITYGCVMLPDRLAQTLYDMAYVGMPVTVLP